MAQMIVNFKTGGRRTRPLRHYYKEMRDDMRENRKKILLHSCCGPCSTTAVSLLAPESDVSIYFYNPNITCGEEYARRLEAQVKFLEEFKKRTGIIVELIEEGQRAEDFYLAAKGLEGEPEGGKRCRVCFKLRMSRTAEKAKEMGFDAFDTTLSVSPYKDSDVIASIGKECGEIFDIEYLAGNYKKKDGYGLSCRLSKEYGLYRQDYCGCLFSARERESGGGCDKGIAPKDEPGGEG